MSGYFPFFDEITIKIYIVLRIILIYTIDTNTNVEEEAFVFGKNRNLDKKKFIFFLIMIELLSEIIKMNAFLNNEVIHYFVLALFKTKEMVYPFILYKYFAPH